MTAPSLTLTEDLIHMTDRKLVSVRKIDLVVPHGNADRLEVAILGGWPAVVGKGQFKAGDLVVFCEIDTQLPPRKAYDFLAKSCSRYDADGNVVYRLRTVRLRGQLSQGLVLPLSAAQEVEWETDPSTGGGWEYDGADLTELFGATKYEKPVAACLAGTAKGNFPSFIQKTDENRIQNIRDFRELPGNLFFKSEKLDGSSCTIYRRDGVVGVCSRNLDLIETEGNSFWKVAREQGIIDAIKDIKTDVAVQGELCGPGIQGNRYKLDKHEFFAFNVYDIAAGAYMSKAKFDWFCDLKGIQMVPELGTEPCPSTVQEVLDDAEAVSHLHTDVQREGVVWVADLGGERVSFKAISNRFLEEGGE